MRLIAISMTLIVVFVAALSVRTHASAAVATPHGGQVVAMQQAPQPVPSNSNSRVGVQVGVLCAAVVVVVVIGLGAYVLRRALGLTAPPPKQDANGHH